MYHIVSRPLFKAHNVTFCKACVTNRKVFKCKVWFVFSQKEPSAPPSDLFFCLTQIPQISQIILIASQKSQT
jgi:hypothetical protein